MSRNSVGLACAAGLVALVLHGLVGVALAQDVQQAPVRQDQADGVNADRLPLDLTRIERALHHTASRDQHDGLNLHFVVDVYGQLPRIVLFSREDNLVFGRAPYGSPTHREMLDAMTPKEYRAPAADFSALMRWVQQKLSK